VEQAGRYGADVATVGAMVQLLTRGIFLDTMPVDSSDQEIEIRVRYPQSDRVLSTLDTMRVRTADGLIPLSAGVGDGVNAQAEINKITPWLELNNIVPRTLAKGDVAAWVGETLNEQSGAAYDGLEALADQSLIPPFVDDLDAEAEDFAATRDELLGNYATGSTARRDLIAAEVERFVASDAFLPASVGFAFAGDQEEQAESADFLGKAFVGALGLMFVILLAQFNSLYNSVVVLLAVILSVTGVLIGMLVMDQTFSIIMTGTGIVALAGIVVNNNIVLIDTYQDYSRFMPRIEAIIRTAEDRIRPVLLTTITTMAGLTPMMLGISVDFANGGYTVDAPTSLWWKSLATAVVFGLGVATILTLVVTPALLAIRVWISAGFGQLGPRLARAGSLARDERQLRARAAKQAPQEVDWFFRTPAHTASTAAAAAGAAFNEMSDDPQAQSPLMLDTPADDPEGDNPGGGYPKPRAAE